ncbi:MAG TPA: CaiB/BaiF CoA-transferase family protein [Jatrophihabitantaceae bacterium]
MTELPLAGVRVLELGGIGPGPFAAMLLADLGAEVVAVTRVDDSPGADPLAQGKRRVPLDLRNPDGVAAALDLVSRSQILIEGFRPGTAERLGLGPEDCWRHSPALVYGRMTGWGQSGPLAATAGHDINYIGLSGALHAIGRAGQPPSVPLYLVGDLGGGAMFLVAGVLAALHVATATGTGRVVDAAIVDGAARLMTPAFAALAAGDWVDERGVNLLDSGRPWYDVYETSDGKWMSVGAIEDRFYAELVRVLDLPAEFACRDDPAGWPALRAVLAERFAARTRAEWERIFTGVDACVAPVLSLAEAPHHPHLRERGTFRDGHAPSPYRDGPPAPVLAPRITAAPVPASAPRITAAP